MSAHDFQIEPEKLSLKNLKHNPIMDTLLDDPFFSSEYRNSDAFLKEQDALISKLTRRPDSELRTINKVIYRCNWIRCCVSPSVSKLIPKIRDRIHLLFDVESDLADTIYYKYPPYSDALGRVIVVDAIRFRDFDRVPDDLIDLYDKVLSES